jgi:hypothetical protein
MSFHESPKLDSGFVGVKETGSKVIIAVSSRQKVDQEACRYQTVQYAEGGA